MFKEDKNELILSGRIVNIFPAKGCVIVTLCTGNHTFPKVVCWQQNAECILSEYKVTDDIHLLCNFQSSRHDGKLTTSIFCTSILNKPLSDKHLQNSFVVRGRILSVFLSDDLTKIIVETVTNGRHSTVPICVYNKNIRWHYEKNQPICMRGTVETRRKSLNGKTVYFTNYVASHVSDF